MSQMATPEESQAIHLSPAQKPAPNVDMARVRYGAWLVGAAFVVLAVVFGVAVSQFTTAADVTATVGSVATVIGTIIGAFFGVQVGSSGKESAEAGRNNAERAARMALGKLNPADADEIMKAL
jgi:hypothetical protein